MSQKLSSYEGTDYFCDIVAKIVMLESQVALTQSRSAP
jgi:hypothetical protein